MKKGNKENWNKLWTSLFALVFTLIIWYGAILAKTYDTGTVSIVVGIVVALIVGVIQFFIGWKAFLIDDKLKSSFLALIQEFTETHKGFINGIYTNYPHHFTEIFQPEQNGNLKRPMDNCRRGAYIWMKNIGVTDYSNFAKKLLEKTNKSIHSTTYFPRPLLINALSDADVQKWIQNVNQWKGKSRTKKVHRVHVFANEEGDYNYFISCCSEWTAGNDAFATKQNFDDFKKFYLEEYTKCDDYKVYITENTNNSIDFFGEYIIFDEQIMLKYNGVFRTLELFIGSLVGESLEGFNKDKEYFLIKTADELKEKLNGARV